jgi:hypothetical protein
MTGFSFIFHFSFKKSISTVMWQWLYTGFGLITGFIGHWVVLFTNNYRAYKYSMLFRNPLYHFWLVPSGSDNRDSSVGLQVLCISLCWGLIRKHCPQQILDCCVCTWLSRDWLWCTYLAAGDQCLMLPRNGPLCDISLIPRFFTFRCHITVHKAFNCIHSLYRC